MGLLDVNVLVALAWDSHVHHVAARSWFRRRASRGWASCPLTEAGFVRVCSNPKVLPAAISVADAREVLRALRAAGEHRFLANDVSMSDPDLAPISGHREITDAILLAVARRNSMPLVSFDCGVADLAGGGGVELLRA